MPIESAFDTIADLNPDYPTGTDYRKDGDDHIRGIKQALKNTFPDITAPLTSVTDSDLLALAGISGDPINTLNEGGLIPSGIICMWGGLNANIPAGWNLCDGTNGTPDLSDKFILGTILDDKASGGTSHTATTSEAGAHNHGDGSTGSTVLTVDQIPSHGHPYRVLTLDTNAAGSDLTGGIVINNSSSQDNRTAFSGTPTDTSGQQIGGTGGGAGHTHTLSSGGTHSHTVDTRGKYYKLAFIQKA